MDVDHFWDAANEEDVISKGQLITRHDFKMWNSLGRTKETRWTTSSSVLPRLSWRCWSEILSEGSGQLQQGVICIEVVRKAVRAWSPRHRCCTSLDSFSAEPQELKDNLDFEASAPVGPSVTQIRPWRESCHLSSR